MTTDTTEADETPEQEAAGQPEAEDAAAPSAPVPRGRPPGAAALLSRPSDFVARPGFRNPANAGSKAQKATKQRR